MLFLSISFMGDTVRKLLIIFLVLLIPVSCSKEQPPERTPLTFPMTAEAHLQYDAGNARVVIDYESEDCYTVRYLEPKIMTGITYGVDPSGMYMSFGESRIPVTDGEACFASIAIGRLLCPHKEDTVEITYEGGYPVSASGRVDGRNYTLSEIKIQGR